MKVFTKISEAADYRTTLTSTGMSVGFVPTMGALHSGHLSLVSTAGKKNNIVAVSIVVNPIQFYDPKDLEKYPRNIERDLELLAQIMNPEDYVFIPDHSEMYPEPVSKKYDFGFIGNTMEGAIRPGHFNGVGVVVDLLFRIIKPDDAFFGEKDYQQIAIIRKMVEIEKHPVNIISCPTLREPDGLAMSSRNQLLDPDKRENAGVIYQALKSIAKSARSLSIHETKNLMVRMIESKPGFSVEYIEIADQNTLQPIDKWTDYESIRCFIAVSTGRVRLIDNIIIELDKP